MRTEIEWNFDLEAMPKDRRVFVLWNDGRVSIETEEEAYRSWKLLGRYVKGWATKTVVYDAAKEASKPNLPDWAAPHVTLDGWMSGDKRIYTKVGHNNSVEVSVWDDGEIFVNGTKIIAYAGKVLIDVAIKVAEKLCKALGAAEGQA